MCHVLLDDIEICIALLLSDEFEVVGEFDSRTNEYKELAGKKPFWPSGSAPPDVPKCGFAGRRCPKQSKCRRVWSSLQIFKSSLDLLWNNSHRLLHVKSRLDVKLSYSSIIRHRLHSFTGTQKLSGYIICFSRMHIGSRSIGPNQFE